jgi:hypothetical protein
MDRERREIERLPRRDRFEREASGRERQAPVLLAAGISFLAAVSGALGGRVVGIDEPVIDRWAATRAGDTGITSARRR